MKFTEAEYARQRTVNQIHELEQRVEELESENLELQDAKDYLRKLCGFVATCRVKNTKVWMAMLVATCRVKNTKVWMAMLVDHLNAAALRLDPKARFWFDGDWIQLTHDGDVANTEKQNDP